jgi:hypothetical protein
MKIIQQFFFTTYFCPQFGAHSVAKRRLIIWNGFLILPIRSIF